jgi:competence ComEA-like helix-hairpin-helix protein
MLSNFRKRLQSFTHTTRSELIAVLTLLAGLWIGAAWQQWQAVSGAESSTENSAGENNDENVYVLLDSLSHAEQSTYSGTTPAADPVPELASGDTLVRRESPFGMRTEPAGTAKIISGNININTATKQDLMRLPGVGEVTAEKILAFRAGKLFRRTEDMLQVSGIGKKKFAKMQEFLRVK